MRRFLVARTAAWASGASTPMTGTASCRWRSGSAAAVAELHAATMSFTPCPSRYPAISAAKRRISSSGRGPYGSRAPSPRYTKSSCGSVTRHSCRTVSPPMPESKTPMGRGSIRGILGVRSVGATLAPRGEGRPRGAGGRTRPRRRRGRRLPRCEAGPLDPDGRRHVDRRDALPPRRLGAVRRLAGARVPPRALG